MAQLDLENTTLTRAHIERSLYTRGICRIFFTLTFVQIVRQENRQVEEEMTALREQVSKLKASV